MIVNVPTADELRQVAIRTYFIAWLQASKLFEGVNQIGYFYVELKNGKLIPTVGYDYDHFTKEESEENFAKFTVALQPDVHAVLSLIQHSQELALKTFICEQSPYLLLLGSDIRHWAKENADFTDLKTIDASDLLRVVTAICDKPLSASFQQTIEKVRRGRNSFQHLGKQKEEIGIVETIKILTQQYIEMYPDRNWLTDFNESQQSGLDDLFIDSDFTSKTTVLDNISNISFFIPQKTWRQLLGFQPKSRLLECKECIGEAKFDNRGYDANTVEILPGFLEAHCRLCEQTFKLKKHKCEECDFDLAHDFDDGSNHCFQCARL